MIIIKYTSLHAKICFMKLTRHRSIKPPASVSDDIVRTIYDQARKQMEKVRFPCDSQIRRRVANRWYYTGAILFVTIAYDETKDDSEGKTRMYPLYHVASPDKKERQSC